MKFGKIEHFFKRKKKKDFFSELGNQMMLIVKDILLLYRNFIHWNLSKIIINIVAIIVGLILALPFLLFSGFVGLIDPIPWGTFIAYQMQGVSPILEVLSYASLHTFSFVIMTISMILALVAFLIGNAYSNVLYVRLYAGYLDGEKPHFKKSVSFSRPRLRRFVGIALWHLVYLLIPVIIILLIVLGVIISHSAGAFSFEVFSLILLLITLVSIFVFSYIIYRLLFSVIILARDPSSKILKHSGRDYIKKSIKLTSGWRSYVKFLFIACILFLLISPFRSIGDTLQRDAQNLSRTIEYRALVIASPEDAERSSLRETALFYEDMSDDQLFANYRGATLLTLFLSFVGFFVFSGLYTMFLLSFYTRVLR